MGSLYAGSAQIDITPKVSLHLFGYPHVARASTGVHDPLYASALYLRADDGAALFVSCDIIFIPKDLAARARGRIRASTGVDEDGILLSATHTHSGPTTVAYLSNESDDTVPPPDGAYLKQLEDGIVEAAERAVAAAELAEVGVVIADGSCTGTNRRSPDGPSHSDVPVMVVRGVGDGPHIAIMLVCSMHPTVLHEDSTLISADFPGATRAFLQENVCGVDCPVLHHSGASGNQSPRHVTQGNTFEEATRIGEALGASIVERIERIEMIADLSIRCACSYVELPLRSFGSVADAEARLDAVRGRFEALQRDGAPRAEVRTAECDVFGAEETLTLARAAEEGRLASYAAACMPAEVQCISVGPWKFLGLPGEFFVEYALSIEAHCADSFVITMANGELQGYVVTQEAIDEGGYEASNALFKSPESGQLIVEDARALLDSAT